MSSPLLARSARQDVVAGAALLVAAVLWLVSLRHIDTSDLRDWGLLPELPVVFFLALALNLGVIIAGLIAARPLANRWLAPHVGLLVLILYGTAALVEDAPRLPWVYKHIGVTRYIELNGSVNPAIDIYQRWPGFFAWTAQLGEMIGFVDPVSYAGLMEPGFALLDVLLVLAIARQIWPDRRWCWLAATFYSLSNWVSQNYFAPQAFAYSLQLFICLLLFVALRGRPRRWGLWLERLVGRIFRSPETSAADPAAAAPMVRVWAMAMVLGAFSVVVASHQLTPYLVLLALGPLFLLGYFRPTLLAFGLAALAILYLVPNLSYIEDKFGLFSGFNPVGNATYSSVDRSARLPAAVWQGRGAQLIFAAMLLLALIGLVRRARAGQIRSAVIVGWFTMSPFLVLAVQTYGGEGRQRAFLFALPWLAMGAAWAFRPADTPRNSRLSRVSLVAAVTVLAVLFVPTYFQPEAGFKIPRTSVTAAQWLDARVAKGDLVLVATGAFPALVGPHYDYMALKTLADYKQYYPQALTAENLVEILTTTEGSEQATNVFVVFSDQPLRYDLSQGAFGPSEVPLLERQVALDPRFSRTYDQGFVRIYRLE